MDKIRLGRTNLMVTRSSFGALPIQRRSVDDAVAILHRAYDAGINFFDTARAYSDSEHKLGRAFTPAMRGNIILASKTQAKDTAKFWDDLHTSLSELGTDYIDIYQLHNPSFIPKPGGEDGLYDALLKAKEQGKIRHIAITNHILPLAQEAAESGLYDTVQFPFSLLANSKDLALAARCRELDVGFIAMKALSGGLLTNATACVAFMRTLDNVVPIWGIQHMHELEEFIALEQNPPAMTPDIKALIESEKEALAGDFCRGCGYCLPCPANIEINFAARISFLVHRSPYKPYISRDYQAKMQRVEDCIECGACASRCPYELDTPNLIKKQYALYKEFVAEHADEVE